MLHQRIRWQILLPLGMLLFSTLACGGFQDTRDAGCVTVASG